MKAINDWEFGRKADELGAICYEIVHTFSNTEAARAASMKDVERNHSAQSIGLPQSILDHAEKIMPDLDPSNPVGWLKEYPTLKITEEYGAVWVQTYILAAWPILCYGERI